jgi:hypothetical protein
MSKQIVVEQIKIPKFGGYNVCEEVEVEQTIDAVIVALQHIKDRHKANYTEIAVGATKNCGCRYDCGCAPVLVFYGTRFETDQEQAKRLGTESENLLKERAEYERLKKKFEAEPLSD